MRARRRRVTVWRLVSPCSLWSPSCRTRAHRRSSTGRSTSRRSRRRATPYYPFLLVGVKVLVGARGRRRSRGGSSARTRPRLPASGCSRRSATRRRPRAAARVCGSRRGSGSRSFARDLALVPRADRRRARSRRAAGRCSRRGCTPTRCPSSRCSSVLRRDRLGGGPRLARRRRGLRRRDVRARASAILRAGAAARPGARRPTADARAAPPLRARLRVAPASAPRLTRGDPLPRGSPCRST